MNMAFRNPFSILISRSSCIILAVTVLLVHGTSGEVLQLGGGNFNNIISTHELVFVNFYADWCRFSQILKPVFEETAKKVQEMYPDKGKVAFGQVDCDNENGISTMYHISKYPTLKLFRNGQVVKKEYRGQRTTEALTEFIKGQVEDSIKQHNNLEELEELENVKRNVIGYFKDKLSDEYKTFRRVAMQLRDDCVFHAAIGDISAAERAETSAKIVFRPPHTRREDIAYQGDISSYDDLLVWMQDKCVPLVREITFENAEELTEEGLPFLILFHKLEDTDIVKKFNNAVMNELLGEKNSVNFLTADGSKFTHPLHHLGKTANDLPILAIDSFRHMYLFKHDVRTDLEKPGLLKQFVADLHSGKLHREFHHGPDPEQPQQIAQDAAAAISTTGSLPDTQPAQTETKTEDNMPGTEDKPEAGTEAPSAPTVKQEPASTEQTGHLPKEQETTTAALPPSSPPESVFKNLKPSQNRYTIVQKDEL